MPKGKRNKPVTRWERKRIKALSRQHWRQRDIAKHLSLTPATIGKIQRALSCAPYSTEPLPYKTKLEILSRLHSQGAPTIAKDLRIGMHKVYEVRNEYRLRRPVGAVGYRTNLSEKDLALLRRDLRRMERKIAHRYNVTHAWLKQFRNRQLRAYSPARPPQAIGKGSTIVGTGRVQRVYGSGQARKQ